MKSIEDALMELVETCDQMEIPYVVMGGLAVRVHGIPRPTHDVDMTLSIEDDQFPGFFERVERLGYNVPQAYRSGWLDEVAGMKLMKFRAYLSAGKGIDVDLFIADSPFQRSVLKRCQTIDLAGKSLKIVSPEDLVLLKLVANRPRDLADVGDILFTQGKMDEAYMRRWASELGVSEGLEKALADV